MRQDTGPGACPSNPLLRAAILSLRAGCSLPLSRRPPRARHGHYSGSLLAVLLLLGAAAAASAAKAPCSIHPKKGATKEDLSAIAKVSRSDAQKTALATFKDPSRATVKEAELEAEHGCLVYSFDIELYGRTGIEEIQVDAGNGKVLSRKHESPAAEAAEKAKDKARTGPKN
jgi:hypothetical protein